MHNNVSILNVTELYIKVVKMVNFICILSQLNKKADVDSKVLNSNNNSKGDGLPLVLVYKQHNGEQNTPP